MGKQTTLVNAEPTPTPAPAPRNVIVQPLDVRIEVYVGGQATGWIIAWTPRRSTAILGTNINDRILARALHRFERWRSSILSARPRARRVEARGVRLLVNDRILCAFAESEDLAELARIRHQIAKPVGLAAPDDEPTKAPSRFRRIVGSKWATPKPSPAPPPPKAKARRRP